jgi:phosphatidate phosphatase APP1
LSGQGFPRGVLRLKEFSEASGASILDPNQQGYKLRALEAVLLAYPQVRFTLFGDDGEQDPEIYAALQKKFPAQIEAVWIRRVDPNPARARFEGQGDTVTLLVP